MEEFAAIRRVMGWTREEMGKKMGYTAEYIGKLENDTALFTGKHAQKVKKIVEEDILPQQSFTDPDHSFVKKLLAYLLIQGRRNDIFIREQRKRKKYEEEEDI